MEAGAAPEVEQVGAGEGVQRVDGGVDDPGPVGREVLQLVDVRGVPDVRAADHDERRPFDPLAGVFARAFAGFGRGLRRLRRAPSPAWRAPSPASPVPSRPAAFEPDDVVAADRLARVGFDGDTGWAGSFAPAGGCGGPLAGHSGPAPSHGAGRHRRGVHEQRDELPGTGRAGPLDGVEVGLAAQHELGVALLAHEGGELGAVAAVDRLGADVRLGVARAVPVEVVPARVPSRGGRTRRSSPRGRTCRRGARRCGRTGGSAAASRRRAWPRAAAGR